MPPSEGWVERPLGAEGHERGERPTAHDGQPDAVLVDAAQLRAADLDDLAARRRAGLRQPARCQVDVAIEATDGRELDETGSEAHVVELDGARERLVGERACCALRVAVERGVSARRDLTGPGDAQGALGGRECRQRVAQSEVLGDGAASGHARQERDRDRHARAHEQGTPGPRTQAPARHGEHGGRASPARAAVRAGSAVRGVGGLVHVGRAPNDTVDAACLRLRCRRCRARVRWYAGRPERALARAGARRTLH